MKNFLIGLVLGVVFCATGGYVIVKEKVKKAVTRENTEKVVKATEDFGDTLKGVFE